MLRQGLRPPARFISWLLRVCAIGGLAIDAYVHADLAARYDPNQGSAAISQGDLFRIEAGVSAFAALVLVLSARLLSWALAILVAGSALGGLLLYRYASPGALGPLPDMVEPSWYPEKTLAAVAESVALVAAVLGFALHAWWLWRTPPAVRGSRSGRRRSERSPRAVNRPGPDLRLPQ